MELEVKYKCDDVKAVLAKLKELGFELGKTKDQIDTYLIVNETTDEGTRDYLRVREDKLKEEFSLDYHRVLSDLETDETEVEVKNKEDTLKILKLLGQEVKCEVHKERKQFKKDKLIVTVDKIDGLGDYVEVELQGELNAKNEKLVRRTAEELGLKEENRVKKKGYPDLLLESQKN